MAPSPESLLRLASKGKTERIIKALSHKNPEVRHQAATLLGDIGAEIAEHNLVERLDDDDERVRYASTMALSKLNSRFAIEPLTEIFRSANASPDPDWTVLGETANALARLGDHRSLEVLSQAIAGDEQGAHQAARALAAAGATAPLVELSRRGSEEAGAFEARAALVEWACDALAMPTDPPDVAAVLREAGTEVVTRHILEMSFSWQWTQFQERSQEQRRIAAVLQLLWDESVAEAVVIKLEDNIRHSYDEYNEAFDDSPEAHEGRRRARKAAMSLFSAVPPAHADPLLRTLRERVAGDRSAEIGLEAMMNEWREADNRGHWVYPPAGESP